MWIAVSLQNKSTGNWSQSVWYSTDGGLNWSQSASGLPANGIIVVKGYNGVVFAGGWSGLYKFNGSSWSHVTSVQEPTPTASGADNVTTKIHRHLWYGVQDIYLDPNGYWYVTCYSPTIGLTTGKRGVWRSTDGGTTFSQLGGAGGLQDKNLRRAVYVDSCGARIHITSGVGFSSPVSGSDQFGEPGLEVCRFKADGTLTCVAEISAGDGVWGFPQAHAITSNMDAVVYTISPGYGVHAVPTAGYCDTGGGCGDPPCETERPGKSPDGSAARSREEDAAKLPRTLFSVADARGKVQSGRLVLYDLTGRKVREPRPGVYFVVERNKAGVVTARRTVVVTP
jgi:hypothetical protein